MMPATWSFKPPIPRETSKETELGHELFHLSSNFLCGPPEWASEFKLCYFPSGWKVFLRSKDPLV